MRKIIVDTLGADMGSEPIITGALRALKEIQKSEWCLWVSKTTY